MWRATMTRTINAVGGSALVVAILAGSSASTAQGFLGRPSPATTLQVVQDPRSDRPVCIVTQTVPPAGKGGLIVYIKVPSDSTLKSALLRTKAGALALDVMATVPLAGEYATIIDSRKANCAATGALVLEVDGDVDASTIGCPEIPLFNASACDESSPGKR